MRRKLNLGFVAIILLLGTICAYTLLSSKNVQGLFSDLQDDIIPGAIAMTKLEYEAVEIRNWTFTYAMRGNVIRDGKTIKEWLQQQWADLEKDAREHLERGHQVIEGERQATQAIVDLSQKLVSVSAEVIDLKDQGVGEDELLEKIRKEFGPVFYPLRKVLNERAAAHLNELSWAETKVHDQHNATIRYITILGLIATFLALLIGLLMDRYFVEYVVERKRAQEKIERLNAVLKAIRNVNQVITTEKDRDRLIEKVCRHLVETRGYHRAWIVLFDESGRHIFSTVAGHTKESLPLIERFEQDKLPPCWQGATIRDGLLIVRDVSEACSECPVPMQPSAPSAIAVRLEFRGKAYGMLGVCMPAEYANDAEEQNLFKEVAGDIAFALHAMEGEAERRRAEEELKREKERAEKYLDIAGTMIAIVNADETIALMNKRGYEVLCYKEGELIGRNWFDALIPERIRDEVRGVFSKLMAGEIKPVEFYENPLLTKNGEERLIAFHNTTLRNPDGHIVGVLLSAEDITKRKQTEDALRESEDRYKTLVENLPQRIFLKDKDLVYISCNQNYAQDLGIKPDEIGGKTDYEFYPKELAEKYRADDKRIMESGMAEDIEEGYIQNGRDLWIHTVKTPIRDEKGNIAGVLGIFWDITESRQAEEALRESEERFRNVSDCAHDVIIMMDNDGCVSFWNKAAEKIFGYREEEILGKQLHETLAPERFREAYLKGFQQFRKTGKGDVLGKSLELTALRKDGTEFPIELSLSAMELKGKWNAVGILRDITERKRAEQELSKVEKLESIGILAGGIAHDFNNFLTSILGNISLAKMDVNPSDEIYANLEEAEKATVRARDLTQQLLTFSKGGEPIKKGASIEELIRDSVSFAMRGSNVKSEISLADNLHAVEIDTGQISQVLQNLVINAAQAMPDGGKIEISAKNATVQEVDQLPLKNGEYVKIIVRDYGTGIVQEHLQKVFDPYFTTKQQGSGLGLATAYSIITKHGGYINVESELGKGTVFEIYLPASNKEPVAQEDIKEELHSGTGRILFMDDEDFLRDLASKILGKLGYTVDCAVDGAGAVELLKQAYTIGQPYHVIILDLTVPGGMGGKEAAQKMREIDPDIRTIVCSGYSNDPVLTEYWKYGFCSVITKPYKPSDLSRVVHEVIVNAEHDSVGV